MPQRLDANHWRHPTKPINMRLRASRQECGGLAKPFASKASTPFTRADDQGDIVVISDGELKVTAFSVSHAPIEPAVGYSFEYKGRKVVISGDTTPSARVEAAAKGADLLVHEALAPNLVGLLEEGARAAGRSNLEKIFKDIVDYHTTPEQAADIAQRAGVGYLLLHHIVPALPLAALEGPFLGVPQALCRPDQARPRR